MPSSVETLYLSAYHGAEKVQLLVGARLMAIPSKYRRAFGWRFTTAEEDAQVKAIQAFQTIARTEVVEMLEDYLDISRKRRRNRLAIFNLQLDLLRLLSASEGAIKRYRKEEEEQNAAVTQAQTDEERERAKATLEGSTQELFMHRAIGNVVRSIGDGIAWRALDYDRATLWTLCQRQVKQQVMIPGSVKERVEMANIMDRGEGLVIFNGLTNWLAFGDLTVVHDDGSVELVEVKSSRAKNPRLRRQKKAMRKIVEVLNFGEGEMDNQRGEFFTSDIFPDNGLADLRTLLEEAKRTGVSAQRLSNTLYIECTDLQAIADPKAASLELDEMRQREIASWIDRGDLVAPARTLDQLAFSPNRAPFTVFPFPAKMCIELLIGRTMFTSFLNLTALAREFEYRGWTVRKGPEEYVEEGAAPDKPFLVVEKAGCIPQIAAGWMARLQTETLRPQVVISIFEQVRSMGRELAPRFPFFVFEREAELWK